MMKEVVFITLDRVDLIYCSNKVIRISSIGSGLRQKMEAGPLSATVMGFKRHYAGSNASLRASEDLARPTEGTYC